MSDAIVWLVIVTSSWSGQAGRSIQFASMAECRAVLSEIKISHGGNTAVVAFCSPNKPWFER